MPITGTYAITGNHCLHSVGE